MVIKKMLIKIMLLCLVIFLGSPVAVYAQGPEEEETPLVIAPSGQLNLTFKQLGYDTRGLNRRDDRLYYRVDLPGNFEISPTDNYLNLITSHLPEIPDKFSVLKVRLNEQLLFTFPLTQTNAISSTVRIELPAGLLQNGSDSIRIELDTSATCEEPGAIVDVLVDENSTLSFGYQQNPYPTDLSLYPFPFTERTLLGIPVTMILPDHPTSDDLSAAATVAAGLGQMSGGAIDLTAALASELGPDIRNNHHLIVIGKPDDNALFNDLALPLAIDTTTIKSGQGVLEEILSPWNEFRLVLVVSGLDDEGVSKASHALNRQAHFLGMRGPVAIVIQLLPVSKSVDPPRTPSMTLASLGYEDEIVYGAQPQDYRFYFQLPFGWHLEESPFFVLKFTHAEILDPYESAIDIELNNVPIGSALLDGRNAKEGELTVSLPRRSLRTGSNRLEVAVEMNFPDSDNIHKCKVLDDERAWTVISSDSEIFLPYNVLDLRPDLSLFPYPFSQASGFDQTLFVLPDQLSPSLLNDLIQLAVRLGSATNAEDISAHVAYASEIDEGVRRSHHLILLGRPTENALLHEVNAYLPQPFASDSDLLEPLVVDTVAFSLNPDRDAGLLEITASPWDEEYSLLAVSGTTDEGVRLAVQTLLEQGNRLKGNLAVIERTFAPLFDEPNQVTTYAIDTRPPTPTVEEVGANNAVSENDLAGQAERWWR
jgi:hypothetical protein